MGLSLSPQWNVCLFVVVLFLQWIFLSRHRTKAVFFVRWSKEDPSEKRGRQKAAYAPGYSRTNFVFLVSLDKIYKSTTNEDDKLQTNKQTIYDEVKCDKQNNEKEITRRPWQWVRLLHRSMRLLTALHPLGSFFLLSYFLVFHTLNDRQLRHKDQFATDMTINNLWDMYFLRWTHLQIAQRWW